MEKENKKKRDVARKKYMETVRALVDYVKKRDIRYIRFERELRKRREEEELARARKIQETKEKKKQQRKAMREQMQGDIEEEEKFRVEERKTAFLLADLSDDEVVVEVNGNEGMLQEDASDDDGDYSEGEDDVEEEIYACEICK
jgi:DnaJ family protein A protein 5